jgi:hypothetical protein
VLLGFQPTTAPPLPAKFVTGSLSNSRHDFLWRAEYDTLRNIAYSFVNVWPLPGQPQRTDGAVDAGDVTPISHETPRVASTPVMEPYVCPRCGKGPFKGDKGLKGHLLKVHGSNTTPDSTSTPLQRSSASECETSSTER